MFKTKFSAILCIFSYYFGLKMKLQNLRIFTVENRHGENHLGEGGTGRNLITENFKFFVIFPCLFLDPLKNVKIWQIYRA